MKNICERLFSEKWSFELRTTFVNMKVNSLMTETKSMHWFLYDNGLRHERVKLWWLLRKSFIKNFLCCVMFSRFTSWWKQASVLDYLIDWIEALLKMFLEIKFVDYCFYFQFWKKNTNCFISISVNFKPGFVVSTPSKNFFIESQQ